MTNRIVVSDTSCLIDLRKASLLAELLRLPYEVVIPNTLFEEELLRFTAEQKKALQRDGLKVVDLPGPSVQRAIDVNRQLPRLSVHDGFAFALAESQPGCILLSGDGELRKFASAQFIEVRGVLWVIDELHRHAVVPVPALLAALAFFDSDATVRLPARDLAAAIRRFEALR